MRSKRCAVQNQGITLSYLLFFSVRVCFHNNTSRCSLGFFTAEHICMQR